MSLPLGLFPTPVSLFPRDSPELQDRLLFPLRSFSSAGSSLRKSSSVPWPALLLACLCFFFHQLLVATVPLLSVGFFLLFHFFFFFRIGQNLFIFWFHLWPTDLSGKFSNWLGQISSLLVLRFLLLWTCQMFLLSG